MRGNFLKYRCNHLPLWLGLMLWMAMSPSAGSAAVTKEPLAVMNLEAVGTDQQVANVLSILLRDEIHKFGKYEVLSQEDLEAVAKRESIQMKLGCDNEELQCLLDFGQKIGTEYMLAGTLSKIGNFYMISVRLLDTQGADAGIRLRINKRCQCRAEQLLPVIEAIAAEVIGDPIGGLAPTPPPIGAAKPVPEPDIENGDPLFMTRLVNESDLAGKSKWALDVMRNEIFARHGRRFSRRDLQQHFDRQPWYRPLYTPQRFPVSILTPIQTKNVALIRAYQKKNGL